MRFTPGVNYPWTVLAGKPNYGCDFGLNVWGNHAGVTTHDAEVRADLSGMASLGAEVVRWFVFTDGRGGVRWDDRGRVGGLALRTIDDLDAALEIARDAGVSLCLVLFDYSWMVRREERAEDGRLIFATAPAELATPDGQTRVIGSLVRPLVDRYGRHGPCAALGTAIHSIDVINEPDWVTRELECDWRPEPGRPRFRVPRPFAIRELRALVRGVADLVHARTSWIVTVGGGRVRFVAEWDDPAWGLDVIQVHLYPDVRRPYRDRALLYGPARALGVSKPVIVGEFPANGDRAHPPDHRPPPRPPAQYLSHARAAGYAGAWPWSYKGIDAFGAAACV